MILKKANKKAIDYACKNFHYAKRVPQIIYAYNVYNDNNEWCGVIVYGGGASRSLYKNLGLNSGELLELERVALNGKQKITSKALALSLKLLKKENPLCKLVVSFADTRQKHVGTIYKATNWIYLGKRKIGGYEYFYNNRWVHCRTIGGLKNKKQIIENCPKRKNSDKFKYIYCFDNELKEKYKSLSLPYPTEEDLT